ncbi:MAG TPA: tetratricopeptide repeat protein [Rudaea sp.]|nr:tetratricopeptide repeat protein [Rudaea sp.]
MAFEVLDEHEQGELVQKWLRENVLTILIGVGLGLVLIFGWQQWNTHRARHNIDAATQFDVLTGDADKKDFDAVKQIAEKLKTDYGDTPYAVLASMREAEFAVQRADLDGARAGLDWAYQHAGIDALKALAGVRLARVELARKKPQDALDLLAKLPPSAYTAQIGELRGDALVALDRKAEARTAYSDALANLDPNASNRAFVQMKLNDLGAAENKGS